MGWSEVQKTDVSRDDTRAIASRTFRVWDYSPAQVLADPSVILGGPDNTGLPKYGDAYPGDTSLLLRRYTTSAQGFTFDVTAEYSDGEIAVFPPRDLDYAWQGGFQTETSNIPFAVQTQTKVPGFLPYGTPPGTPIPFRTIYDWEFKTQPVLETRQRHSRKVKLTADLAQTLHIVEQQNNRLMNLGGTWYRFEAGDYRQLTGTTFEITYSLVLDTGTPNITVAPNAPGLIFPNQQFHHPIAEISSSAGRQEWLRPPFCELVIYPVEQPTDPTQPRFPPEFRPFCPYDMSEPDGLGWQQIPGF